MNTDLTNGITFSPGCIAFFTDLVNDAGNWSGIVGLDCNISVGPTEKGYLTQLKKAGLVTTDRSEGISWLYFTPAGIDYAKSLGLDTTGITG